MNLLFLETKRIFKTRITWILLLLALFLSVVLAYLPTTFTTVSYQDTQGTTVILEGLEAIRYSKTAQKGITGTVTPDLLRRAVETYQACLRDYNVTDSYELPDGVYTEKIFPIAPLLSGIREVYADPLTGAVPSVMELTPQQAEEFYANAPKSLHNLMQRKQGDHPAAQESASALYSQVPMPFSFYPGSRGDVLDYQSILIFLITLFCAVISAPVFASEYQTQADDILRCTKHGRGKLGMIKILSALGICSLAFALCLTIYSITSNSLFGWECTKTSLQLLTSASVLLPFNLGECQGFVALASGISFLAAIGATLFISSKCKTTVSALSISILVLLLPLLLHFAIPGPIGTAARTLLPSGGIGLQNSYFYAILGHEFINIGEMAFWTPTATLAVAAVELPLFLGLALFSYTNYRLK